MSLLNIPLSFTATCPLTLGKRYSGPVHLPASSADQPLQLMLAALSLGVVGRLACRALPKRPYGGTLAGPDVGFSPSEWSLPESGVSPAASSLCSSSRPLTHSPTHVGPPFTHTCLRTLLPCGKELWSILADEPSFGRSLLAAGYYKLYRLTVTVWFGGRLVGWTFSEGGPGGF